MWYIYVYPHIPLSVYIWWICYGCMCECVCVCVRVCVSPTPTCKHTHEYIYRYTRTHVIRRWWCGNQLDVFARIHPTQGSPSSPKHVSIVYTFTYVLMSDTFFSYIPSFEFTFVYMSSSVFMHYMLCTFFNNYLFIARQNSFLMTSFCGPTNIFLILYMSPIVSYMTETDYT